MRRITGKSAVTSADNFLSETDASLYISDASGDVLIKYPGFTDFTVTGTDITPTPDSIDERLLSWGAACLLLIDEEVTASGDAIAIKAGPISLDTSKSVKGLSTSTERICSMLDSYIENLIINGKAGVSIGGKRIDNFIETLNQGLDPERL